MCSCSSRELARRTQKILLKTQKINLHPESKPENQINSQTLTYVSQEAISVKTDGLYLARQHHPDGPGPPLVLLRLKLKETWPSGPIGGGYAGGRGLPWSPEMREVYPGVALYAQRV